MVTIAGYPDEKLAKGKNITATYLNTATKVEQLKVISRMVSDGHVKAVVSNILPFTVEGVREAHQISETGHARGKIVVRVK